MKRAWRMGLVVTGIGLSVAMAWALRVQAQGGATSGAPPRMAPAPAKSSYLPVVEEPFEAVFKRMSAAKADVMKRQTDLLAARYDLADRPASGVTMSRGKAIQDGVRVKLPSGGAWDALARMAPDEIRDKGLFPAGFLPLPHPNHPEGGMVFPKSPATSRRTTPTT